MLYVTTDNFLSAFKQAFTELYNSEEIPKDKELWREDTATIVVNSPKQQSYLKVENNNFHYAFNFYSYFPNEPKDLVQIEMDYWKTEFLDPLRIDELIGHLTEYPYSKRAIINLWSDKNRDLSKSAPCATYLFFRKKGEFLDCNAHLRANNTVSLLLMDMHVLSGVQRFVCEKLDLKMGIYTHYVDSLHFYKDHLERIENQKEFMETSEIWQNL